MSIYVDVFIKFIPLSSSATSSDLKPPRGIFDEHWASITIIITITIYPLPRKGPSRKKKKKKITTKRGKKEGGNKNSRAHVHLSQNARIFHWITSEGNEITEGNGQTADEE